MKTEYRALVAKVESFTEAVGTRRQADLACASGCSGCCHTWLTVSMVEADAVREALAALATDARAQVRSRGERELTREEAGDEPPRCAMLDDDERCSVYDARPLVCRTQGHALRYPRDFISESLIGLRRSDGDVTWCPLNYTVAEPDGADVLDAERVDQILGVVATRYAGALGHASDARASLSALAAEGDVLHDGPARHDESDHTRFGRE